MNSFASKIIDVGDPSNNYTPDEKWNLLRPGNIYCMQADFVRLSLGAGNGNCLVVGSPLFEAMELRDLGWRVTFVDIRLPPDGFICDEILVADFTTASLPEDIFDAASSTCVLCHAGMGRYAEDKIEDGDGKMLANIFRSLKRGALFAVCFGPVHGNTETVFRENWHRAYSVENARKLALRAGFSILEEKFIDGKTFLWKQKPVTDYWDRDYISMLLKKP